MAVFEENDVLHTAVLPVGSEYVTNDVALGLKISIDTAEKIKIREGSCLPGNFKKNDIVKYSDLGAPEDGEFASKEVAEIIEARIEEIMESVDKELKKIGKSGMLPAGVVLTGGGAKLPGAVEVAKNILRLPASLGYPQELISNIGKVSDLSFTTSIGLVLWGSQLQDRGRGGFSMPMPIGGSIEEATKRLRKLFKNILPS
jgi:cell division protein FtsA